MADHPVSEVVYDFKKTKLKGVLYSVVGGNSLKFLLKTCLRSLKSTFSDVASIGHR